MSAFTPVVSRRHLSAAAPVDRRETVRELVEREAVAILSYFARRTNSAEDAADLLSETLLVIWRRESSIPIDAVEARMWMFGVARRVLSTHRRTGARRLALTQRLGEQLASTRAAGEMLPDDEARDVQRAIESLPDLDREIIRLVYWEGFALSEVATILRMRDTTVRSRHHRARERLRGLLSDDGGASADT